MTPEHLQKESGENDADMCSMTCRTIIPIVKPMEISLMNRYDYRGGSRTAPTLPTEICFEYVVMTPISVGTSPFGMTAFQGGMYEGMSTAAIGLLK